MLCNVFLYKFWHLNLGTKAANKGEAAVTRRDKCSPLQPLGRSCSQSCSRLGLLTLVFSFVKQNIQPGSIWKQSSDGKCQHLGFGLLLVCAFLPHPKEREGAEAALWKMDLPQNRSHRGRNGRRKKSPHPREAAVARVCKENHYLDSVRAHQLMRLGLATRAWTPLGTLGYRSKDHYLGGT